MFIDRRIWRAALVVILSSALVGAFPSLASAQGYVSPGLGISFGSASAEGRANFVADIGWLPEEPIGVEVDATYAPSFFKSPDVLSENSLATVMGDVIFAAGGERRGPGRGRAATIARPYVTVGLGLMSERVQTSDLVTSISNQHLGVSAGVGVIALSRRQIGVRVDVRYFHDLVGTDNGGTTGIDFGAFHFWRGGIGAVLTF